MNDAKPSKSARKKSHLELQSLGEKLIPLELAELEKLALDESLLDAVIHAKSIRSRGALRRQRQLIGKLMRESDADAIQASLRDLGARDRLDRQTFREAEGWRDRIAAEGAAAVSEFGARTGDVDRGRDTELKNLVWELETARNEAAKRRIRRLIFREVYRRLNVSEKVGDQ
jgi:ribosome-associated protein